jgi:hypothetical protein
MKRFACVAIAVAAIGFTGANLITETQSLVGSVFEELKLESMPSKVIGGPQRYKVTKKTLDHLKKLMDEGKIIVVGGDGKITVEKDK